MSKGLHLKPRQPLEAGQNWNEAGGIVTLNKAGNFTVEIIKTDALRKEAPQKLPPFNKLTQEQVWQMPDIDDRKQYVEEHKKREKQEKQYELDKEKYDAALLKDLENLSWCWETVGKGMAGRKITHNNSFSKGVPSDLCKLIKYPKILEGSGLTWLEVFTENDPAECAVPHGLFIKAIGTPKIIAAEWRDYSGQKITEEIAFGSTVYLHIYTEALYGDHIEIQLRDTKFVNADLTPTPSDKDGDPIQKLEAKPLTRFRRQVNIHKYDDITKPPAGTITDAIISNDEKEQTSNANVQKCVFPVFIERAWEFQGAGSTDDFLDKLYDDGSNLTINPIVYHKNIKEGVLDINNCKLKVSREGVLLKGELTGNNPLVVEEKDQLGSPENKNKIDFTFGIFLDGTRNNMHNSEARQKFEKRTKQKAYSQETVEKYGEEKYRFVEESSYENDLSNPAILYQNYIIDETNKSHPIFKIYTEGIGTLTEPDEKGNLNVEDYKNDDTVGFAIGTTAIIENTGIRKKVRKAQTAMAEKILLFMNKNPDKSIGTITVDVFGFSRGAAAARNFVHEITYPAYFATGGITEETSDRYGYKVSDQYRDKKKKLPTNGHLGYLLMEGNNTFEKLEIRFAGLYDTVPHHGLLQSNDAEDLGLNDINKANYVVHLVAADEHRANFSLVKISSVTKTPPESGKKGGIELYLPGVHCDVGGSYVEGMPEKKEGIDFSYQIEELQKLKDELVHQGWFTKKELHIKHLEEEDQNGRTKSGKRGKLALNSDRKYLSNQYSFIALHMMVRFCEIKQIPIMDKLFKDFNFKSSAIQDNVAFLTSIKEHLFNQAFNGYEPYEFIEPKVFSLPNMVYDPQSLHETVQEYYEKQAAGQKELDKQIAEKNKDLIKLRSKYLHWNSVYGLTGGDGFTQPYHPNKENGKRVRKER